MWGIDFHGRSFLLFIGRAPNKASGAAPEYGPISDAATKTAAKHRCLTVVPRGINRPYMPSRQTWAKILRPIPQSVQNGQFLSSLAPNAPHLLIAPHADKGIERLLVQIIAAGGQSDPNFAAP